MLFWSACRSWQGVPAIDRVLLTSVMIVKASAQCICPFRCFHYSLDCAPPLPPFPSSALQQPPSHLPPELCPRGGLWLCLSCSRCSPLTEDAGRGHGPRYRTFVPKVVQLENKQILKLPYRVGVCWLVYLKFTSY